MYFRKFVDRAIPIAALTMITAVATASPIGTMYNAFMDAPVLEDPPDGLAIESHQSFIGPEPGLSFDGVAEKFPNNVALTVGPPPHGSLLPAAVAWINEMSTPMPGGEWVEVWIFGDDDGDEVPPEAGSYGPLFANPIDFDDEFANVVFGLETLYWLDMPPGQFAVVKSASFGVTFDGGADPPVPITPLELFIGGLGTADEPLFIFGNFDKADFTGNPTDFHAHFEIMDVPEPATLALVLVGGLAVLLHCGRRRSC